MMHEHDVQLPMPMQPRDTTYADDLDDHHHIGR